VSIFEQYMIDGNTVTLTSKDGRELTKGCNIRSLAQFIADHNAPVHAEFRAALEYRPTRIGTMVTGGNHIHSEIYTGAK
jgi:hypothetical protein